MRDLPFELRYSEEHEWVRTNGDGTVLIGITDFAQDQLGDIVYLSLPKTQSVVTQFGLIGEVESVKSVSDLFSPVSGEVIEVNQEAMDHPEIINEDPYGQGWLIKVRLNAPGDMDKLLSAAQYEQLLATKTH